MPGPGNEKEKTNRNFRPGAAGGRESHGGRRFLWSQKGASRRTAWCFVTDWGASSIWRNLFVWPRWGKTQSWPWRDQNAPLFIGLRRRGTLFFPASPVLCCARYYSAPPVVRCGAFAPGLLSAGVAGASAPGWEFREMGRPFFGIRKNIPFHGPTWSGTTPNALNLRNGAAQTMVWVTEKSREFSPCQKL